MPSAATRRSTRIHVILGDDIAERIKNMSRCAMEKRVVEHFILAEKP